MNRRERLMATLAGRPVDRPPVRFYELIEIHSETKLFASGNNSS